MTIRRHSGAKGEIRFRFSGISQIFCRGSRTAAMKSLWVLGQYLPKLPHAAATHSGTATRKLTSVLAARNELGWRKWFDESEPDPGRAIRSQGLSL